YECTVNDHAFIDGAKKISAEPGREELVLINDVPVNRNQMECLFYRNGYLYDEVINAYIHLLRTQHNMINRPGGTCYLENTSMTELMKGDEVPRLAEMVLSYLQHDMLFLPINIKDTHWYLAVVNARRRKIHVLDSFRTLFGLKDLKNTLDSLSCSFFRNCQASARTKPDMGGFYLALFSLFSIY
uniref:Ubiquitin-like protease family profile domain-containing protein n=1 Tax=Setaria italica TaxID=4555 RepID=K3ZEW0_SETIT